MKAARLQAWTHDQKPDTVKKYSFGAILFVLSIFLILSLLFNRSVDPTNPDGSVVDLIKILLFRSAKHLPLDSWEPMMTALSWLHQHAHENVYASIFFSQHVKFQYPLTSLLPLEIMSQLGLLHLTVYILVNLVLVLLTAIGTAILMLDLAMQLELPGASDDRLTRWGLGGLGFIGTLCFYPIIKALSVGQIQVWLNCFFIYACIFFVRDRRGMAGALLGASTLIKPQMSLFLFWALLRKDWRFAIGWTVIVVPGLIAAGILYGFGAVMHYTDVLAFIGQHGEGYYANQSVNGLVNRLLDNGVNAALHDGHDGPWRGTDFAPYQPIVYVATLLSSIGLAVLGLLWNRSNGPEQQTLSFMVAAILFTICSPVAWVPHYGIVLPAFAFAFVFLLSKMERTPQQASRGLMALAIVFFFVGNNLFLPLNTLAATHYNFLQSYLFFATLIFLGYLIRISSRIGVLADQDLAIDSLERRAMARPREGV